MKKLLLAACLFLACHPATSAATQTKAPNFTLRDINGDSYNLYEHQGEIIILNFWATWCGPCTAELPHLSAIDKKYADKGVDVVAISIDAARELSKAKTYIRSRRYGFTPLFDTDTSVVSQYNPSKAIPYTLILDREMHIVHIHTGYISGDENTYIQIIEEMLQNESR